MRDDAVIALTVKRDASLDVMQPRGIIGNKGLGPNATTLFGSMNNINTFYTSKDHVQHDVNASGAVSTKTLIAVGSSHVTLDRDELTTRSEVDSIVMSSEADRGLLTYNKNIVTMNVWLTEDRGKITVTELTLMTRTLRSLVG